MEKTLLDIDISTYTKAPENSILVRHKGKWVARTFTELNKAENGEKLEKIADIENDINGLKQDSEHFKDYCVSHFLVAYNTLRVDIMLGLVQIDDPLVLDTIFKIGQKVINREVTVEKALEVTPLLKDIYTKTFLSDSDFKHYPEV